MELFPQYHNGDSWIHRRDPRSKTVFFIAGAAVALAGEPKSIAIMLLILMLHGIMARLPPARYKAAALVLGVTAVTLVVVQWIFNGMVLGLIMTGDAVLRLACFMYAFMQLVQWTHPMDLALMGVKMGVPYRFAMLPVLMVRFIPVMERELKGIFESQYARGERFDSNRQKLRGFLPVLLPLVLRSLQCGQEIALAMETKGFGYANRRTFLRDINFTAADGLWTAGMVCLAGLLIFY
jgi:energy-coupling factor transport system permease protein